MVWCCLREDCWHCFVAMTFRQSTGINSSSVKFFCGPSTNWGSKMVWFGPAHWVHFIMEIQDWTVVETRHRIIISLKGEARLFGFDWVNEKLTQMVLKALQTPEIKDCWKQLRSGCGTWLWSLFLLRLWSLTSVWRHGHPLAKRGARPVLVWREVPLSVASVSLLPKKDE